MRPSLLAVFGMAVVAGAGFTLGKRLVTKVIAPNWKDRIEPWVKEQAESVNRWGTESRIRAIRRTGRCRETVRYHDDEWNGGRRSDDGKSQRRDWNRSAGSSLFIGAARPYGPGVRVRLIPP